MNYNINFVGLGAAVAIALLPTQATANALTRLEDADAHPPAPTSLEPLPAIVPDVVPEAEVTVGIAELPPEDLELIPAMEVAEPDDPIEDAGAAVPANDSVQGVAAGKAIADALIEASLGATATDLQPIADVALPAMPLLAQDAADPALTDDGSAASGTVWHFSFEPYIALPVSTTGNLRVNRINVPIDVGLSQVLDPLNFAFMGQFEAWYEHQGIVFSTEYFAAGRNNIRNFTLPPVLQGVLPGTLTANTSLDMLTADLLYAYRFSGEPENGYGRVFTKFDLPPVSFDLMGGLRFSWLAQQTTLTTGLGRSIGASTSNVVAEPVIRGRLRWNTSDTLALKFDTSVSGFGLGEAFTFSWSGLAALEWLFSGNTSLNAGYQVNYVTYSGDSGARAIDLTSHGPYLSVLFRF
ncbi:hypothetical protein VB780_05650 [Leptolyngbya sp. CCNP1308]|uniref:hypothetical protein n=1 Tax=Leptolyngbya sp. CCNP1308 TaxID=3110255 RepID=UPI002B1EF725|nr:hypothetical protein [Leptolyngbya sp. CCNP1308]MEA5448044.1 hypothetical protein [Leptolyngbya sp. CCNP1308]